MLMYLCPALMDWLSFFVFFAVFYSAGIRGMEMRECAFLSILLQVAYMIFSLMAGHLLTRRNAKAVLLASTVMCGVTGVCCLWIERFGLLSAAIFILGLSAALFFNSFQTFMRGEAEPGELKKSVALYTLFWSMGAAVGNVTAGFLFKWGLAVMTAVAVFMTALILIMLIRRRTRNVDMVSADEHVEQGSSLSPPVSSSYIWVGWLMIFTATFIQRPIFTFLPPIFARDNISSLMASMPLFAHMAMQALAGLAMWRFRDMMYRRTPFWVIQVMGAAAFFGIWLWPSYGVCLIVLPVLGIYAGFAYFCAVYYASNSGRRSFNIGVNEALVGLGSIAGILVGNWWMWFSGSDAGMYLVCGVGLVVSILLQLYTATFINPKSRLKMDLGLRTN